MNAVPLSVRLRLTRYFSLVMHYVTQDGKMVRKHEEMLRKFWGNLAGNLGEIWGKSPSPSPSLSLSLPYQICTLMMYDHSNPLLTRHSNQLITHHSNHKPLAHLLQKLKVPSPLLWGLMNCIMYRRTHYTTVRFKSQSSPLKWQQVWLHSWKIRLWLCELRELQELY